MLQRAAKSFKCLRKALKGLQKNFLERFEEGGRPQEDLKGFISSRMLREASKGFEKLRKASKSFERLRKASKGFERLQKASKGFERLRLRKAL